MKHLNIALASLLLVGAAGGVANAQNSPYLNAQECTSEVSALDVNSDGYVTSEEIRGRGTIETNVDTDGDGRISQNEMTVACNSKTMEALTPKK